VRGVGAFATEAEYGRFLLARLRPRSRLMAVAGGHKGDSGAFIETDGSDSRPCKVEWDGSGSYDWVDWREIELEVRAHTPPPIHTPHAMPTPPTMDPPPSPAPSLAMHEINSRADPHSPDPRGCLPITQEGSVSYTRSVNYSQLQPTHLHFASPSLSTEHALTPDVEPLAYGWPL
jgi:hypothetical protein